MAAADAQSVGDQLKQLNEAKKAVLSDPQAYYSQIMVGILPLASPNTNVELRRWATDFIAEAFSTPTLPGRDKEGMSLQVVGHLRTLLENPREDPYVLRSAIQAASSIYPHAMRWMYVSGIFSLCYVSAIVVLSLGVFAAPDELCNLVHGFCFPLLVGY